jgi:hypothetical protein
VKPDISAILAEPPAEAHRNLLGLLLSRKRVTMPARVAALVGIGGALGGVR